MSNATFKIAISGTGVFPETTRANDLAEFLANIEKAISKTAAAQGVEIGEDDFISLTSIDRSSNKLTFTIAAILLSPATSISQAVETKRYDALPRQAHEALHEISKQAVKQKWEVRFEEDNSLGIKGGTISEKDQVPPPPTACVEGTTSVYGRCIRVGGVRPRAEIQLYQGGTLYIVVSEQMARDLAKNLYEQVCVEGVAKWNTQDWTIEEFRGMRICEFTATDPVTGFKNLAAAAKGRWDGVDAIEYVKGLRSEGEKV